MLRSPPEKSLQASCHVMLPAVKVVPLLEGQERAELAEDELPTVALAEAAAFVTVDMVVAEDELETLTEAE